MTYLVFVLVILASVFYRKTSSGLAFSSIGENPQSADAAGILYMDISGLRLW